MTTTNNRVIKGDAMDVIDQTQRADDHPDGAKIVISHGRQMKAIAAAQTDSVLGNPSGAIGDYLKRVIVTVATAASGTCSIKDGSGAARPLTAANTAIGVYVIDIEAESEAGPWSVTTGAGATVLAVGNFT